MMNVIDRIKNALHEDKPTIDVTSDLLLSDAHQATAHVISKAHGVFFGQPIIDGITSITPSLSCEQLLNDGDNVAPNDICVTITGDLRTIVEIERTLLNFLQRLSGIATITSEFVTALNDPSIAILDTRKTTPLLRDLEKQAVLSGGGRNHRFGLHDMVLVKENHLHLYLHHYGIEAFNQKINAHKKSHPTIPIEIEIPSFSLLKQLDLTHVDIVMFDNMSLHALAECIDYLNTQPASPLKEVSGNITLDSISLYKGIDIDRISIGSLTHSVNALDLSLLVV